MFKQRTLRQSVETVGIGLHSGRKVHLVLRPAEPDTGILYRRVDIRPAVEIPAHPLNVNDTRMATTVNVGKAAVATIEHLMSAFNGLGIDNVIIEVDSAEIPIMDGSGASFVFLLHQAGIVEQDAPKRFVRVTSSQGLSRTRAFVSRSPSPSVILRSTARSRRRTSTSRASRTSRRSLAPARSVSCRTWRCFAAWGSLRAVRSRTPS